MKVKKTNLNKLIKLNIEHSNKKFVSKVSVKDVIKYYDIIRKDFELCHKIIKDNGFIIWDDYSDNRFIVKKVVDDILKEFPRYSIEFIQTRNTLFDNGNPVDDYLALMRVVK